MFQVVAANGDEQRAVGVRDSQSSEVELSSYAGAKEKLKLSAQGIVDLVLDSLSRTVDKDKPPADLYNSVLSHLCTRLASPPPTPAEIKPLLNTGLSRFLISLPAPTTPEAVPLLALHWILRWTAARGADMLRCPVSALSVLPPRADVPACLRIVLPPCPTNRFLPPIPSAPRPAGGYKTDRSGFALDLVPIPCRLLPPTQVCASALWCYSPFGKYLTFAIDATPASSD
eukprot:gene2263-69_t